MMVHGEGAGKRTAGGELRHLAAGSGDGFPEEDGAELASCWRGLRKLFGLLEELGWKGSRGRQHLNTDESIAR